MFFQMALIILLMILFLYLLYSLLMFFGQEKFLFFQQPMDIENKLFLQNFACQFQGEDPEAQLHGFCSLTPGQPIVIYFGGNGEEISHSFIEHLEQNWPLSLVFVNYRGYGESEGKPSENALKSDALKIYDTLMAQFPDTKIYLIGRSLGSALALHLAARRKVGKLLLVTPFDSVAAIAKEHHPYLFIDLLLRHPFYALADAQKILAPTYVFLAEEETIIPYNNSLKVVKALPNCQKVLFILDGDHHTMVSMPQYFQETAAFFLEK